jgi:aryl-alcohol dehydrogenase-like predicted oxidoreductase
MRYKLLGRSGLRVSELCLGAMTFGDDWGWGAAKDESGQIFDLFAQAGGNFIDTANIYTNGTSETLLRDLIAKDRDHFVLATKYVSSMRRGDPNAGGAHRKNLVQALEASLRRLGTDRIDLYWVHLWDFLTPVDEVMRALDDQVRAGKVLYVGVSDAPAWIVAQANTLADCRGWTPFAGIQVEYSLVERTVERELLPMAESLGVGVTAWSPLAAGVLTGKYDPENAKDRDRRLDKIPWDRRSARNLTIARVVVEMAKELGRTPAQVALNWIRQRNASVIPIVGARKLDQARDNLACIEWKLDESSIARLDSASAIDLGFPTTMIVQAADFVYGGTLDSIVDARDRIPIALPAPSATTQSDGTS